MAAKGYVPKRLTGSTASGTTAVNHDFTVPAGKRWIFDNAIVKFGTQHASNTLDVQHPAGTNLLAQLANFKTRTIDFGVRFPRACEVEAAAVIRFAYVRTGAASTVDTELHVQERDL